MKLLNRPSKALYGGVNAHQDDQYELSNEEGCRFTIHLTSGGSSLQHGEKCDGAYRCELFAAMARLIADLDMQGDL